MVPLHTATAHALRRMVIWISCLLVSLGAHMVASGHSPVALEVPRLIGAVGGVGLMALLIGRRSGRFRPRAGMGTAAILLAVQAVLHTAMWSAPWLFGLGAHQGPPIDPAMVAAHLVATALLVLLVGRAERLLALAVAAVRRLRRLWQPRAGVGGAPPPLPSPPRPTLCDPIARLLAPRGPPRPALTP